MARNGHDPSGNRRSTVSCRRITVHHRTDHDGLITRHHIYENSLSVAEACTPDGS